MVGFADGEIPRIPLNLTLLKGCAIVGVFWGSFTARDPERNQQHLQELLSWYSSDKIKPFISATYTLEEAPQALRAMMERKVKGKVALLIE